MTLLRAGQEALANAGRHGAASGLRSHSPTWRTWCCSTCKTTDRLRS
ncbi:MAG: hypothetical protein WKH64_01610 [Chloroflexia bacterium]